jgi:hypothetical protein
VWRVDAHRCVVVAYTVFVGAAGRGRGRGRGRYLGSGADASTKYTALDVLEF